MTKAQALRKAKSGWWERQSAREIVAFQLYEQRLCMPFPLFHKAVEEALGRSVWTHEFGLNLEGLKAEFEGCRAPATFDKIVGQLRRTGKPVVIVKAT
jgi:hypothetical protein